MERPLLSLGSLAIFCYLFSFQGTNSPSSNSWSVLLFFRLGMANRPRSVGGEGGGITGGCVLEASFELPPLFLLVSRPFRPGRFFWSICSFSSSNAESTWVIINCLGWIEDRLTDSVSESEIFTNFLDVSRFPQNGIDLSPPPRIAEKKQFPLPLQLALQGGLVVRELSV